MSLMSPGAIKQHKTQQTLIDFINVLVVYSHHFCVLSAAPSFMKDIGDQAVDKGDQLKVKIPFTGTGPFDFKLMKGRKEIPSNNRIKFTPFDDYVILQIRGR